MKALLTGASGFLGKYLMQALSQQYDVTTLGRKAVPAARHIAADLSSGVVKLDERFDKVVHAAAQAHFYPKTKEEKESFFKVNAGGTQRLIDELAAHPPNDLIYISTVGVYGLIEGDNIAETHPTNADDPYGLSKIEAEHMLVEASQKLGFNLVMLRLPLIIGKDAPGNFGRMVQALKNGKYVRIGNASAKKSMVLAEDVAELTASLTGKNGVYNLTDGQHPSFRELENVISSHYGTASSIKKFPQFALKLAAIAGDTGEALLRRQLPFNSLLYRKITSSLTFSDALARRELGWQPREVLTSLPSLL